LWLLWHCQWMDNELDSWTYQFEDSAVVSTSRTSCTQHFEKLDKKITVVHTLMNRQNIDLLVKSLKCCACLLLTRARMSCLAFILQILIRHSIVPQGQHLEVGQTGERFLLTCQLCENISLPIPLSCQDRLKDLGPEALVEPSMRIPLAKFLLEQQIAEGKCTKRSGKGTEH